LTHGPVSWALLGRAGLLVLAAGCLSTAFAPREGALWHRSGEFAVPDLTLDGWERVRLDEADVAFRGGSEEVIAVRAACGDRSEDPLRRHRDLWLGIERSDFRWTPRSVGEHEALEATARANGVAVRTVVIRAPGCLIDVVHARPEGSPDSGALERFLAGMRLGEPL
jgi:hypothetical protein